MPYNRPYVKKVQMGGRSAAAYRSYAASKRQGQSVTNRVEQKRVDSALTRQIYNQGLAPETKYFDVGINTTITSASGDWQNSEVASDNYVNSDGTAAAYTNSALIPSAQGSGYGQVNGNRYKLKKIRVRGRLFKAFDSDQADMPNPRMCRLMLILDTQPNGAQAQGEDIIQDVGGAETQFAFKRIAESSGRFRILKDDFFSIDPIVAGTDGASTNSIGYNQYNFSYQYQPKEPIQVNIKSGNATPTVAGLINCNIFLLLGTNNNPITIEAASRCYYSD